MEFIITHNEGKREIHVHSINCPRTKGESKWLYSYIGKVSGNTWDEVVKNSSKGFQAVGKYVYIAPDKCMSDAFPDAVKTKFEFKGVD